MCVKNGIVLGSRRGNENRFFEHKAQQEHDTTDATGLIRICKVTNRQILNQEWVPRNGNEAATRSGLSVTNNEATGILNQIAGIRKGSETIWDQAVSVTLVQSSNRLRTIFL